jgi:hypothetical protein
MVLSDQRTPYSIMYVWAAFEAKSPPTCQDLIITHCNSDHDLLTVLELTRLSSSKQSKIFSARPENKGNN